MTPRRPPAHEGTALHAVVVSIGDEVRGRAAEAEGAAAALRDAGRRVSSLAA